MPETVQSGSVLACNIAFGADSNFAVNVGRAFYYVHFGSLLESKATCLFFILKA